MRLKNRVDVLHSAEIHRWRAAWERLFMAVGDAIEPQEYALLFRYAGLPSSERHQVDAVLQEVSPQPEDDAWVRWWDLLRVAVPRSSHVDLSQWPGQLPQPPSEPATYWEEALALARNPADPIRAMAGALILHTLAWARSVRAHTNKPQ